MRQKGRCLHFTPKLKKNFIWIMVDAILVVLCVLLTCLYETSADQASIGFEFETPKCDSCGIICGTECCKPMRCVGCQCKGYADVGGDGNDDPAQQSKTLLGDNIGAGAYTEFGEALNEEEQEGNVEDKEVYVMISLDMMKFLGLVMGLLIVWNIVLNISNCRMRKELMEVYTGESDLSPF